jgi:hypothetical protein
MSEKINVLIGANIEGLKTALAESGKSLSDFGMLAQQAPKKAKTAVDELNKSYRDAVTDAKNLALMQGQTSEAFYEAQLKAKNLKTQIQQLNEVVGQTGQIAAGSGGIQQASNKFDMLGHSVNQITRELPAFTNSMTTGFMAISNNIPMLVDQINNIRTANASLIAQGQPVQSVFSQLATSIFSWQTALSLGVTILTVYGAEMLNALDSTVAMTEANKHFAESLKKVEEQEKKIIDIITETSDLRVQAMAEGRQKEEAIAFHSYKKQLDALTSSFQTNQIAEYTFRERSKYLFQIYQNELSEIEKKANEKRQKDRVKIDKALEEGLNYKNQIKKFKGQLAVDLKKMPVPQVGKIEFLIDTTNAMTAFDRFKMNFLSTLDDIEAKVGKWSDVMAGLLTNAAVGLGEALVTKDFQSYGESILRMLGDLAIQIGSAIIALGTAMLFGPTLGLGLAYIAGGTGLVILGSAMKANNVSSPKKPNTNSSGDNGSSYGGGGAGDIPSFNPTGMMISIDGLVRGNNIVVALDNQTRMNRRVR